LVVTGADPCSVCAALPDRIERAAKTIPDLHHRLAVLSREPTEWRTIFECQVCGTVWIENYELTGHGERPVLTRVDPDVEVLMSTDRPVLGTVRDLQVRDATAVGGVRLDGPRGAAYWLGFDRAARVVFDRTLAAYDDRQGSLQRVDDPDLLHGTADALSRWLDAPVWHDDLGCDVCADASGPALQRVATRIGLLPEEYLALWRCDGCGALFLRDEWSRGLVTSRISAATARARFPGAVALAESVVEQLRVRGQLTAAAGALLVDLGLVDRPLTAHDQGEPGAARQAVAVALVRDATQVEPDDDRLVTRLGELRELLGDGSLPRDRGEAGTLLQAHP
jgi:hypothetical protein